jgi:very-short-patch-repair endonuclease
VPMLGLRLSYKTAWLYMNQKLFATAPKLAVTLPTELVTDILVNLSSTNQILFQRSLFILFKNQSLFSTPQILNIIQGISKPGLVDEKILLEILNRVSKDLNNDEPSKIISVLSAARIYDSLLVSKIIDRMRVDDLDISSLVTILNGLSNLGSRSLSGFVKQSIPVIMNNLDKMNIDDFSIIIWSLSVSNTHLDPQLHDRLISRGIQLFDGTESKFHLAKVYLWHIHSPIKNRNLSWNMVVMKSRGMVGVCAVCYQNHNILKLQDQVEILLGLDFKRDGCCPSTLFHLDFVSDDRKIVIECLGSTHFVKDQDQMRECGGTGLRRRLLENVGWKVVAVPYHRWSRKQRSERGEYLKNLIDLTA